MNVLNNDDKKTFNLIRKCYFSEDTKHIKNNILMALSQNKEAFQQMLMKKNFLSSAINLHLTYIDKVGKEINVAEYLYALNSIVEIPKYKILQQYLKNYGSNTEDLMSLKKLGWDFKSINSKALSNTKHGLFYAAIAAPKIDVISFLLNENINTAEIETLNKQSVLFHALQSKCPTPILDTIYSYMLSNNLLDEEHLFSPNITNKYKNRITHNLVKSDSMQTLSWLIGKGYGKYFNLANSEKELPIHRAVKLQIYETINTDKNSIALLASNKDIKLNEKDGKGLTAIHIAQNFKNYEMVEYLIAQGADPNIPRGKSNNGMDTIKKIQKDLSSPLMGVGTRASEKQLSSTLSISESLELSKDIISNIQNKNQRKL